MNDTIDVLAIDPGEKVGWARGTISLRDYSIDVTGHGINTMQPFAVALGERFNEYDAVVYETWRLHPHHAKHLIGDPMLTSQLIGVIRYLSWLHPDTKLASQGPNCMATGEKAAPDNVKEILERMPKAHDDSHDGSALRHLSYYAFNLRKHATKEQS